MLLAGDEFRRTQRGNNNAYCQDNEISWLNWAYLQRYREIWRFARGMIAFRSAHPVLSQEQFYSEGDIQWLNPTGASPNWSDPKEKRLACLIAESPHAALLLMFNSGEVEVDFNLPTLPAGSRWLRSVDTSEVSPQDLYAPGGEPLVDGSKPYRLAGHASAILLMR
jgi:isoamylase